MFLNQDCSTLLFHEKQRTFTHTMFSYEVLEDQWRNSEVHACDDQKV